jgi:hypothetical protein
MRIATSSDSSLGIPVISGLETVAGGGTSGKMACGIWPGSRMSRVRCSVTTRGRIPEYEEHPAKSSNKQAVPITWAFQRCIGIPQGLYTQGLVTGERLEPRFPASLTSAEAAVRMQVFPILGRPELGVLPKPPSRIAFHLSPGRWNEAPASLRGNLGCRGQFGRLSKPRSAWRFWQRPDRGSPE